jgi:hypothetical protein
MVGFTLWRFYSQRNSNEDLSNEIYVTLYRNWSSKDRRLSIFIRPIAEGDGKFVRGVTLKQGSDAIEIG